MTRQTSQQDSENSWPEQEIIKRMESLLPAVGSIEKHMFKRYASRCLIDGIEVIPEDNAKFTVFVFFQKNNDLSAYRTSGIIEEMIDAFYEEFGREGLGARDALTIKFEFDTTENVVDHYDGSYQRRMG